jgi:ESCRT-I complex subunit VPS28
MAINLDEEVRLWTTNSERESIENFSTLYGLIVSLEYLERAYVRDSVSSKESVGSNLSRDFATS